MCDNGPGIHAGAPALECIPCYETANVVFFFIVINFHFISAILSCVFINIVFKLKSACTM